MGIVADKKRKEPKPRFDIAVVAISVACLVLLYGIPTGYYMWQAVEREANYQNLPDAEFNPGTSAMDFGTISFDGITYELDNVGRLYIDDNACDSAIAKLERDGFKEIIYKSKLFDEHDRIITYDTGLMGTGFTLYKRAGIKSLMAKDIALDELSVHTSNGASIMVIKDKEDVDKIGIIGTWQAPEKIMTSSEISSLFLLSAHSSQYPGMSISFYYVVGKDGTYYIADTYVVNSGSPLEVQVSEIDGFLDKYLAGFEGLEDANALDWL